MKEVYLINRAIFRALIGRELLSRRLWTIEMTWWRKWKWKWSSKTVNVIAKKTIEQQFSWSILLPTTGMKSNVGLRFVVPLEVRTFWRHSMVEISVDHGKLFSTCYAKPVHVKIALFCMSEKLFSQQASHLVSFWKGSLKVNFLVLYYSWSGLWTPIVIRESQSVIDSYSSWLLRKHRSGYARLFS